MRDNSDLVQSVGGRVQGTGFFLAGVCTLLMLGGCSQELAMLQPATSKLATYHVKELVVDVEGISRSESLPDAEKFSLAVKTAMDRELQTTLRGTNPAKAIIRFKEITDRKPYVWTDSAGVVRHGGLLSVDYFVNLTLTDDRTHDVIAEQWFSVDRKGFVEWLSLSRDEQLNRWSSRLAEQVRLWIGSAEP
ncbi:MAG: hypothetical protein OXL95_01395 [Nitrospira sp.]|nr:hypothetical protein [Nitrospira sp.]